MHSIQPYFLSLLCLLALLQACKAEKPDDLSLTPVLRVESVEPATVRAFRDTVTLVLSYEDLDGDLGTEDPDSRTLVVKDSRLTRADSFHVKPLAPPGAVIHIRGQMRVKLRTLFLLGSGATEQATFTVSIRDRAGRWSEADISPPVTITR